MKIAKETANRILDVLGRDDCSVEEKKLFVLSEIAIILAGVLDVELAELGVDDDET